MSYDIRDTFISYYPGNTDLYCHGSVSVIFMISMDILIQWTRSSNNQKCNMPDQFWNSGTVYVSCVERMIIVIVMVILLSNTNTTITACITNISYSNITTETDITSSRYFMSQISPSILHCVNICEPRNRLERKFKILWNRPGIRNYTLKNNIHYNFCQSNCVINYWWQFSELRQNLSDMCGGWHKSPISVSMPSYYKM